MIKIKKIHRKLEKISIAILIVIFFIYNLNNISYGLPYFWNPDEISFQNSILTSLYFLSGYFELAYNPIYAPIINSIIILFTLFFNELILNFQSLGQIKSKIYFNPELFIYYGRLASLIITSLSIFFLYLIFKKLKINFIIYSILIITFATSIVLFNLSTIMGKNSSNLLIYLVQIYFLIKYQVKFSKFNFKSYLIFAFLASIAWGVNYWPAFISIYAITILHFRKFRFLKFQYILVFLFVFIIFGPVINIYFVNMYPLEHLSYSNYDGAINIENILKSIFNRIEICINIIYQSDKNILLLIAVTPIFFLNKFMKLKKDFFIILILIIEPLILFGLSGSIIPQLRYFGGIICVILILTGIVFNEFYKAKFKYLVIFLLMFNSYFIYDNLTKHVKINNALSKNYSFFEYNKNIKINKSKILYLVDLNFQESLKQNLYYLRLYENNLIKKNDRSKKFLANIEKKIQKIKNSKSIFIENENLKKDITYFNYTFFPIDDLELFFKFIKKDFDYVVIEESKPNYLSDSIFQNKIRTYVKANFLLENTQFNEEKIFLRNQQSIIHYYNNTLSRFDLVKNISNDNLDVIYGINYSLYKLN